MKFQTAHLDKERAKKVSSGLTSLEKTILAKASRTEDIVGIISACKPFTNKFGSKVFATTDEVVVSVNKLLKEGLLERR